MGYFLYKLETYLMNASLRKKTVFCAINKIPRRHRYRMLAHARRRGLFVFVLYICCRTSAYFRKARIPGRKLAPCAFGTSAIHGGRKIKRGILPQASCLGKGKRALERQRLFMEVLMNLKTAFSHR
jgi:hypothetical protein